MKNRILLFAMSLVFYNLTFCQDSSKTIPINISYFGETIVHPGISLGYEHPLRRSNFIPTITIGTYLHSRNHRAVFVNASINWRKTFKFGYSMEYGIGLGYLHTWEHGGKTYVVNDDESVETKTKWGQPNFMPSIKLGLLGWDFRKKTNIPFRINADIIVFGQYPFNNFIMPHTALKLGATYFFKTKEL